VRTNFRVQGKNGQAQKGNAPLSVALAEVDDDLKAWHSQLLSRQSNAICHATTCFFTGFKQRNTYYSWRNVEASNTSGIMTTSYTKTLVSLISSKIGA